MSDIEIIQGDCVAELPKLAAGSVQALRSYLPADHELKPKEIGSEPTPDAFIKTMVAVFREVKRVLRDDGVIFVNLGDSYNCGTNAGRKPSTASVGGWQKAGSRDDRRVDVADMTAGDLLNIPHRVAEALRADGWIWRQTIVWAKRDGTVGMLAGVGKLIT